MSHSGTCRSGDGPTTAGGVRELGDLRPRLWCDCQIGRDVWVRTSLGLVEAVYQELEPASKWCSRRYVLCRVRGGAKSEGGRQRYHGDGQAGYDKFLNRYDTAIVVSAGSDLAPTIFAVHQRYANRRVVVAMPPGRDNGRLRRTAQGHIHVSRHRLYASQLPDDVVTPESAMHRPFSWKD